VSAISTRHHLWSAGQGELVTLWNSVFEAYQLLFDHYGTVCKWNWQSCH